MSDADSIYMAVESNVDGIAILQTSGNISEAVAYAVEKEIPVVTMVYDEPESTLDKFIGIDDVAYGECLLEAIQTAFLDEKDIQNVGLIYNGEINSKRAAAVESALCQNYNLQIADRASSNIFDTSDQVKELVINCEDLQVICCTDDNTTQGAAQAVIDWNMVSRLHIVGTGNSENVLSMVEKGIISATVAIDYQNIGRKTLEALYYSYNGTTSYLEDTENNLRVVTKETVRMYIEERNNAT